MKFFIPEANDAQETEAVYASIKAFTQQTTGWSSSDRRIQRIDYLHDRKPYFAEVGRIEKRTNGMCFVILDSVTYLVCTPLRGVVRGLPILVGKDQVTAITYFDE